METTNGHKALPRQVSGFTAEEAEQIRHDPRYDELTLFGKTYPLWFCQLGRSMALHNYGYDTDQIDTDRIEYLIRLLWVMNLPFKSRSYQEFARPFEVLPISDVSALSAGPIAKQLGKANGGSGRPLSAYAVDCIVLGGLRYRPREYAVTLHADIIKAARGYMAELMMQHGTLMLSESLDYVEMITGEDKNSYESLKALFEK